MKNLLYFILIAIFSLYSCENRTSMGFNNGLNSDLEIESREDKLCSTGHVIPEGSNTYIKDGELIIELPQGYEYVGYTDSGILISTGVLGVRCKCTKGSDCTPAKHTEGKKIEYNCIMGEKCKSCDKIETSKSAKYPDVEFEVAGLVNYNVGVTFITDEIVNQNDSFVLNSFVNMTAIHGNVFEEIFDLPEFNTSTEGFSTWFQDDNYESSESYDRYYFNIFGNICVATMPKGYEIQYNGVTYRPLIYGGDGVPPAKVDCICHEGKSCEYKKQRIPFKGTFEWCDAEDCKDCELRD